MCVFIFLILCIRIKKHNMILNLTKKALSLFFSIKLFSCLCKMYFINYNLILVKLKKTKKKVGINPQDFGLVIILK